jgi:hypothetical protein
MNEEMHADLATLVADEMMAKVQLLDVGKDISGSAIARADTAHANAGIAWCEQTGGQA